MLQLDECGDLDVSGDGGRAGTQISELFDLIDDGGGASDQLGYGVWSSLETTTTTRSPGVRRLASFDAAMISMDGIMSPRDSTTQLQMNSPKPPTATRRPQLRGARSMSSIQMSPFQVGKALGLNFSTHGATTGNCPPVAVARRTSAANLADDHHRHARTRLESFDSWPAPARAAARIPAPCGSVQMPAVPQISDHYKGLQDSREGEGNGSRSDVDARAAAATVVAAAARIADEEEEREGAAGGGGLQNDISGTRAKFADISSTPGASPEMENSSALNPSTRTTSASPIARDNKTLTPSSSPSSASCSPSSSSSSQLRLLQNTRHGRGLVQNTCIDLRTKAIGVSGPGLRSPLLQEQKYEEHRCDISAAVSSSSRSGLVDTASSASNSSPSTSIAPGCSATGGSSNSTLNTHFLHPTSSDIQNLYDSTTGPPHHHHTQPQTIGHSSSLSLVQRRLLRRQKSRDLSAVRKTLSTDALRTRRMDRPRAEMVIEDFPGEASEYMDYLPSPSQEHHQYMISTPLSLSSESLHQQYTYSPHQQQQQQPDLQPTAHLTPSTHANSEWQTTYPAAQNWWDNSTTTRGAEAEGYNIYGSPFSYPQHHHPSPPDSPDFTFSNLATPDLSFPSFDSPYHYTHAPRTPPSPPPSQGRQHHQQPTKKPTRTARRKQSCASIRDEAAGSAFVNFTPKDASKILSGVAPSGSSKTKARREREAAERRRKLSEAAQAAVRAAGGDVGALEGVELL